MRVLLLSLALAACDLASSAGPGTTSTEGVTFRVARTQVAQGETVELALLNGTEARLSTGMFACGEVERLDGGDWVVRAADNQHGCYFPLFVVEPGQTHEGTFPLDVSPGTVRIAHDVDLGGRPLALHSAPIRIIR